MKKLLKGKKGAIGLNDIVPIAITFVVIAVVLGVGADVLTSVNASQTANSYADNATTNGLQAIDELAGWQETWAVVIALAVIIGVLGFLYVRT